MTKQLKRRCIIYIAGVAVYAGAVAANMYYILDDRISFGWYLFAYLIIGFESFRCVCVCVCVCMCVICTRCHHLSVKRAR